MRRGSEVGAKRERREIEERERDEEEGGGSEERGAREREKIVSDHDIVTLKTMISPPHITHENLERDSSHYTSSHDRSHGTSHGPEISTAVTAAWGK